MGIGSITKFEIISIYYLKDVINAHCAYYCWNFFLFNFKLQKCVIGFLIHMNTIILYITFRFHSIYTNMKYKYTYRTWILFFRH